MLRILETQRKQIEGKQRADTQTGLREILEEDRRQREADTGSRPERLNRLPEELGQGTDRSGDLSVQATRVEPVVWFTCGRWERMADIHFGARIRNGSARPARGAVGLVPALELPTGGGGPNRRDPSAFLGPSARDRQNEPIPDMPGFRSSRSACWDGRWTSTARRRRPTHVPRNYREDLGPRLAFWTSRERTPGY